MNWLVVILAVPLSAGTQRAGVVPPDVRAACDAMYSVVARTPGIKTRQRNATIQDESLRAPVAGCRLDIEGSFKRLGPAQQPTDRIADYFATQQWDQLTQLSADGPDGTLFAHRKNSVACLVRGRWDGGADDEPGAPTADKYDVLVFCGPASDFVAR